MWIGGVGVARKGGAAIALDWAGVREAEEVGGGSEVKIGKIYSSGGKENCFH